MSTLKVNTITEVDGTAFPFGLTKLQEANSTSAVSDLQFQSLDVTTFRAFKFICS